MDSLSDSTGNASVAKRLKLDPDGRNEVVLCDKGPFFNIATTADGLAAGQNAGSFEDNHVQKSATSPKHQGNLPSIPDETEQTSQDALETSQDSLELEGDDDNASTVSHLSELSGLSDFSGKGWKPIAGSMVWIQKQMQKGVDPRKLLNDMSADSDQIPEHLDDVLLWKLIMNILSEPPRRHKLRHVNTVDDVVRLLKGAKNIIVLTGAGVSVSCGIPDFRSRDGIYLRLAVDFPDLPHPQAMFDINYFSQDPRPFYKFAKDIYPGNFQPSPCHRFIKLLETHGKLLRNYTQNIDTLEKVANIDKVVECHGSFATATCTKCSHRVTADAIRQPILTQKIPLCEKCHGEGEAFVNPSDIKGKEELNNLVMSGIMKPDIVFFGEGLPDEFHEAMAEDKNHCDLLLVIGSSLKVRPVALIPSSLRPDVPQILINREPLPHCHFDVELLGDCDIIVNHLCQQMENSWEEVVYNNRKLKESLHLLPETETCFDFPSYNLMSSTPVDEQTLRTETNQKIICKCTLSRKSSSSLQKDKEVSCNCNNILVDEGKQLSIINNMQDEYNTNASIGPQSVKERHTSIDSARDSGIGENSNFTDTEKFEEITDPSESQESFEAILNRQTEQPDWQLKVKKNMADRLPEDSFYLVPPSRYIFPGAEIFYDPAEKYAYLDDTSGSDTSESESDNEDPN